MMIIYDNWSIRLKVPYFQINPSSTCFVVPIQLQILWIWPLEPSRRSDGGPGESILGPWIFLGVGQSYENYHLVMTNIAMENHHFLIGKPSINGPFPMAMLNNQRVIFVWKGPGPSPNPAGEIPESGEKSTIENPLALPPIIIII